MFFGVKILKRRLPIVANPTKEQGEGVANEYKYLGNCEI